MTIRYDREHKLHSQDYLVDKIRYDTWYINLLLCVIGCMK